MNTAAIWTTLSIVNYAIVLLMILRILRSRRSPRSMLVWILTLLLVPLLGLILFWLVGPSMIQRRVRKREKKRRRIDESLSQKAAVVAIAYDGREERDIGGAQRSLIEFATNVSGSVVTRGNYVEVSHDAEKAFLELGLAIEQAQSHVHMQYYIFADDLTGRRIRDLLVAKAKEGVEVRLLLDAVGSWKLNRSFVKSLRSGGVKVAFFLPWRPTRRRFQLNCRNHRKLTVIDGRIGFSGSKNIADEYLGRRSKLAPWRDTHLEFRGPCVSQLQEVFVEDWHFATNEDISSEDYFPYPEIAGDKLVQIVPTGPDRQVSVLHHLLLAAVADAKQDVALLSPYFVPDTAMVLALTAAAYRGVRVRVLVPSRSDNWLVLWAGRTFYQDLLDAGVEVYEYDRGMLHSKEVIVDGRWAMVGSANMDIRSFRINFETTNMLYDEDLARHLQTSFDMLASDARRVTQETIDAWSYGQTLAAGVARLATPLL